MHVLDAPAYTVPPELNNRSTRAYFKQDLQLHKTWQWGNWECNKCTFYAAHFDFTTAEIVINCTLKCALRSTAVDEGSSTLNFLNIQRTDGYLSKEESILSLFSKYCCIANPESLWRQSMPSAKREKAVNLDILLNESDFNMRFWVILRIGKCILFIHENAFS